MRKKFGKSQKIRKKRKYPGKRKNLEKRRKNLKRGKKIGKDFKVKWIKIGKENIWKLHLSSNLSYSIQSSLNQKEKLVGQKVIFKVGGFHGNEAFLSAGMISLISSKQAIA